MLPLQRDMFHKKRFPWSNLLLYCQNLSIHLNNVEEECLGHPTNYDSNGLHMITYIRIQSWAETFVFAIWLIEYAYILT